MANLYMPTSDRESDQKEVLDNLTSLLSQDEGEFLVVGGDFNVALHQDLDRIQDTLIVISLIADIDLAYRIF